MSNNLVDNNIVVENARIGFRNFSGKEGKFNPAGRRNFCVFLDYDVAKNLEKIGWNIRWLTPRNEDDDEQGYLQVAVSFGQIPPKVFLVTRKGKKPLNEDTISLLDWAELSNVDLIIRPYCWEGNGRVGVKAYLKSGYFTIAEDEFAEKYANCPDSAADSYAGEDD